MFGQLLGSGRRRALAGLLAVAVAVGVPAATVAAADTPAPTPASSSAAATAVEKALDGGSIPLPGLARLNSKEAAQVLAGSTSPRTRTLAAPAAADEPPTTQDCRDLYGAACYSGAQLAAAYSATGLHRRGINGTGKTVVLPIPFGVSGKTKEIRRDLHEFSVANHLPDPRILVQTYGNGAIPPMPAPDANPADVGEKYGTYEEVVLDGSAVHAVAPGAQLVILQTTEGLGEGLTGLPPVFAAMLDYARHHRGTIFSISYGLIADRPGIDPTLADGMRKLSDVLREITRLGSTFVIGNGDWGVTDGDSPDRATAFPSSSPYALTVGGTELSLDEQGHRIVRPDIVWGDRFGLGVATGAGVSTVFPRPRYQDPYRDVVGAGRSETDLAMNGASNSRLVIRTTFHVGRGGVGDTPIWVPLGGTSLSGPLFAGTLTLVGQLVLHPLGDVHTSLYRLLANPTQATRTGWDDVTEGCNNVALPEPGVPGYCATPGFDIVSGLGTIGNANTFVPAFAATLRHDLGIAS